MAKKKIKKEEVAIEVNELVAGNDSNTTEEMVIDTMVVEEELKMEEIMEDIESEEQKISLEEFPLLPQNAAIDSEEITEAIIIDSIVESEDVSITAYEAGSIETVTSNNEELPNFERDIMVDMQQEEIVVVAQDDSENVSDTVEDNIEISTPVATSFRSDSEAARHYIMELLSDKESHKKQDIVAYINQKAGKEFTEATIINVLRNLINSGNLLQLERGSYKIGYGIGLASKLLQFVDATRKGLEKITTISISEINETDLSVVKDVKELRALLDDMFDRLSLGSN